MNCAQGLHAVQHGPQNAFLALIPGNTRLKLYNGGHGQEVVLDTVVNLVDQKRADFQRSLKFLGVGGHFLFGAMTCESEISLSRFNVGEIQLGSEEIDDSVAIIAHRR